MAKNTIAVGNNYIGLSEDNGDTWSTKSTYSSRATSICALNSSSALVYMINGHVLKTTDNGYNWSDLGLLLPVIVNHPYTPNVVLTDYFSILLVSGTSIVAHNGSGAVYRSTDGGLSWSSAITVPIGANEQLIGGSVLSTGRILLCSAGGYFDGQYFYYKGTIIVSDDGGLSWSVKKQILQGASSGPTQAGFLYTSNNDTGRVYATAVWSATYAYTSMYVSLDNGDTWAYTGYYDNSLMTDGLNPIVSEGANDLISGFTYSRMSKITSPFTSWGFGLSLTARSLFYSNYSNYLFISDKNNNIYRSTDKGSTAPSVLTGKIIYDFAELDQSAPAPVANFTGTPTTGDANLLVAFTDTSTGVPTSWDWDFGDGSAHSTLQSPSHTYTVAGVYSVTLIATNTGGSNTLIRSNYITVNMVTDFTGTPTNGNANLSVNFSDTSLGSPISWDWDFGDGTAHSSIQNPLHIYTEAGTYTVTLIVNGSFSKVRTNYITVSLSGDFVGVPTSGNVPLFVQFTDLSTGGPDSWEWDFGDGVSSVARVQNPNHYYSIPGTYSVTLTIRKSNLIDTEVKTGYITVYPYAINFTGTPITGPQPLVVQFTELLSNITPDEVVWDFGDGRIEIGDNPLHSYPQSGDYTVSMKVRVFT